MGDANENDLFAMLHLCGFPDVVDLIQAQQAEIERLRSLLNEIADWVCEMGYPMDFNAEELPPLAFRRLIEDAWVRSNDPDDAYADVVRDLVAEEGRWTEASRG